jgi:hypothetical protein
VCKVAVKRTQMPSPLPISRAPLLSLMVEHPKGTESLTIHMVRVLSLSLMVEYLKVLWSSASGPLLSLSVEPAYASLSVEPAYASFQTISEVYAGTPAWVCKIAVKRTQMPSPYQSSLLTHPFRLDSTGLSMHASGKLPQHRLAKER